MAAGGRAFAGPRWENRARSVSGAAFRYVDPHPAFLRPREAPFRPSAEGRSGALSRVFGTARLVGLGAKVFASKPASRREALP